jgi:hypothetical protein
MNSEGLGREWRGAEVGEDSELLKPLSKGQAVSEKNISCMPSAWRQTDMRNATCGVQSAPCWHIALLMGLKTKKVRDYNSSLGRRRAEGGVWVLLWLAGVERTCNCFLCGCAVISVLAARRVAPVGRLGWLCRPLFNSKVPSPTVSTPLGLQLPVFSLGWLACPLTAYLAVADRVRTRPWPASWGSTPRASAIGAAPAASAGSMPAAFYQGKCSVHGQSRSSRARPGILHAGGATSSVSR